MSLTALMLLAGCNRYDLFVVVGDEQRALSNRADVLFVIDNSSSMSEESRALANNFGGFVQRLAGRAAEQGTDGLPDAVGGYVDLIQDPALLTDFQLAITTTDATALGGALLGDRPIVRKGDPDIEEAFIANLMCEASCFTARGQVPADPDFTCGDGFTGEVSREFLDCTCGQDAWVGNCGGGGEEGLEAVLAAVCRAVDDPVEDCFEEGTLDARAAGTNAGLVRPDTTFIPVIVTDEGDGSRRLQNLDPVPLLYAELFRDLGVSMAWAGILPALTAEDEVVCSGLAQSWGVLRYDFFIRQSGGLRLDVHDAECEPADFGVALDRLGALIGGQVNAYMLPRKPVEGSIAVEVDGRNIDEARVEGEDIFGLPTYGDGWSYRDEDNVVRLHGEALPEPGEQVRIYFWPRGR